MKVNVWGILFALFIVSPAAWADEAQLGKVSNFALYDQTGKFQELNYYSDQKAVVLISQGNGCPITRRSVPYLNALQQEFASKGVVFFMINANPDDDRSSIAKEAADYRMEIPILEDPSQVVTEMLGMSRTAEAVVIDPKTWQMVYRGAIDERLDYEIQRAQGHEYLREALGAVLADQRVSHPFAPVKGCLISFLDDKKQYAYQDAAPIFLKHCVVCHSPGGAAPWSMDSYQKIKKWSAMIKEVVATKRMPPWHADPAYGHFRKDLSLTPAEIRTLVDWIDQGLPRGQGKDPLAQRKPKPSDRWVLGAPDVVFTLAEEQEIPASGADEFRFIQADRVVDRDMWIKAMDIQPSNVKAVHHGNIVMELDAASKSEGLQSKESEVWTDRSGLNMESGHILGGYSPGGNPLIFPDGTGVFVPKGARLVFRLHYITTGKPEKDRTRVGFYLYDHKPPKVLSIEVVTNRSIKIPAGEKNYFREGSHTFQEAVDLAAIQPHMHYRGKSMKFTIEYPGGRKEVALSVPHYKFRWQRQYILNEPKRLPAGTKVTVEAYYDNSTQNPDNPDASQPVVYGPASNTEMFSGILFYTVADQDKKAK